MALPLIGLGTHTLLEEGQTRGHTDLMTLVGLGVLAVPFMAIQYIRGVLQRITAIHSPQIGLV
jgi:hypothetical protein